MRHTMLPLVQLADTIIELPVVGLYANSPSNFLVVDVPSVPSGFSRSHDVRKRYVVPIVTPRRRNPASTTPDDSIPVTAIRAIDMVPNLAAISVDMRRSPQFTNSSATIAPTTNVRMRNLMSRRVKTSPTCAPRICADVSPMTRFPCATTAAIASPPVARTNSTGATIVAIGMRHPCPKRKISEPARVWAVSDTVGNRSG